MGKVDYLAKYYSADVPGGHAPAKKRKKSKRKRDQSQPSHITVVDEDEGWPTQAELPTAPARVDNEDESDDGPMVENAAEVHHQLQLLQGQAKFSSQWETESATAQLNLLQDTEDDSPPRHRPRHDTDDDSPQRRLSPRSTGAASPVAALQRHDSEDYSPPRRTEQARGGDTSQQLSYFSGCSDRGLTKVEVGKGRPHGQPCGMGDYDDESPPRRPTAKSLTARQDASDESPPRRRNYDIAAGHLGDGASTRLIEVSQHEHADTPHKCSSRGISTNGDREVHRRKTRHGSDDESPPRRKVDNRSKRPEAQHQSVHYSNDAKKRSKHPDTRDQTRPSSSTLGSSPPQHNDMRGRTEAASRLGQGLSDTGGLVESHIMAEQIRQKRLEDQQRILEMDASKSGRGASSTFRVNGKVVTKDEYQDAMAAKPSKRQPRYLEEDVEWKSGLVQRRAAQAEQQALERESKKKFQREFDEDADEHMQQEIRTDDPMARFFSAKHGRQGSKMDSLDAHADVLTTKSGFTVPQAMPPHSWIKRGVQPLPNRFKIKPGRHWDGVHRGNGFEQKFVFQYQHNRAERERDRYVLAEDL